MCIVSAVGEYWKEDFTTKYPAIFEDIRAWPAIPPSNPSNPVYDLSNLATKEDIEKIRKEMLELKELLRAAIKFDAETDQEHCENEDKISLIKKVADAVGVDLKDLNLN